eukprot:jgi/Mesvir1/18697/Mv17183-RA.1
MAAVQELTASLSRMSVGSHAVAARATAFRDFTGLKSAPGQSKSTVAFRPTQPVAPRRLVIRAARVAGVEIPNNKRIEFALQYIYGVGPTTAKAILAETNIENKRTRELTEEELSKLRDETNKYQVEGDLRRFEMLAIKRLKDIQCYRGKRHIAGLPCRGQRTKNNARTRRGKKSIAIAGKKKVTK